MERLRIVQDSMSIWGDWQNYAECRNSGDPESFFPLGETSAYSQNQIEDAKAICRACPVLQTCLEYSIETRQEHGIWGGQTEVERKPSFPKKAKTNPKNHKTKAS